MYFDQILLLLYLRAVLFRFSAYLSEISRTARDTPGGAKGEWAKAFQDLRWRFMLFTNLYQFPLLSNQQQGIEMYTLARECMEVDDLFKEVQEEIHSSHDYLSQQQNQVQTQRATLLTEIAAIVSAIALTIALFSMDWFIDSPFSQWLAARLGKFRTFSLFLIVFLLLVSALLYLYRRRSKS
jgi:predicted transcriptional regulator with HTH domain